MEMISMIISAALLLTASFQDAKEKQFYLFIPVLMFLLNAGVSFVSTGTIMTVPEWIIVFAGILLSCISGQKIGLGDILILTALMPLCHINGCIRIFADGVVLICTYMVAKKIIGKKKEKIQNEIAMVPFLTAGFALWVII